MANFVKKKLYNLLYNIQINARALISQSAMEKSRVF